MPEAPKKQVLPLLLSLLGTPTLAAEPGTVTTQATARDRLPNTVADVTLQIEARARTLADVQRNLAANSTALLAYLKTTGATRTTTQSVTVQPQTDDDPPRGQPARILGYDGAISVTFQLDADQLGTVLSGSLTHGANTVQDTTLHPRQQEMDAKRQSLAIQATRQAMDQARAVAEAAGRHLGAVRTIAVDAVEPATVPQPMKVAAGLPAPAMAAPVATASGDAEVSATVSITMDLLEPDSAPH